MAAVLACAASVSSALPKATEVYAVMGFGWNLGNTMEAPSDPTSWGNSFPTKALFDSVKAAGFKTVRIPTAWYSHADTTTNTINAAWMDSVKTVVDYCVNDSLYCILNIHWDSGWLENNVFDGSHATGNATTATTDSAAVHKRQTAFWTQIANKFKTYNEHLLFAGENEPGVNDAWLTGGQVAFTSARMGILKVYEQAFLDAVRATGGNNATRTLIIQAPRTDITYADSLFKGNMATDPAGTGYMMAEVHFYPYQFSMMTADADWGTQYFYWDGFNSTADLTHNTGWNVSSKSKTTFETGVWVDSVFNVMKTDFYDKGIPVVIGEFGAFKRVGQLTGDSLRLHLRSRAAFYGKVASSAKAHGLLPIAWDTGDEGSTNSTIIRRQKGTGVYDYEVLNAMRKAYGLDTLAGNSIDALVSASTDASNKSVKVVFTPTDTNGTGTIRFTPTKTNWTGYKSLVVRALVTGSASTTSSGTSGWFSADFAVMSGSAWTWTDTHFSTLSTDWMDYSFTLSTSVADTADASKLNQMFYVATPATVDACVINMYSLAFTGTMTIDYVALVKADGTLDTIANFNKATPTIEGNISSVELITTPAAAYISTGIRSFNSATNAQELNVSNASGLITASFNALVSGMVRVTAMNPLGQVIAQKYYMANKGANQVSLATSYRGVALVQVRQNSSEATAKVILK